MRRVVPASQQRALQDLIAPKRKRGQPVKEPGCMLVIAPCPGYWQMTPEQQMVEWEKVAAPMQAALMEASKEDTFDKPRGEL